MKIIQTEDNSHTLYVSAIDETYHSIHGAVSEALHVFIEAGLNQCAKNNIRILEVGFGTGLNAYLTFFAGKNKNIEYFSIEKYPLQENYWKTLNYAAIYGNSPDIFEKIHSIEWGKNTPVRSNFSLCKIQGDFVPLPLQGEYDVIFYDAFSPQKQPELWTDEIFEKLFTHTSPGGILTTYCAKGAVRRAMQAAGYTVERIQGAKGKKEMLRAKKMCKI